MDSDLSQILGDCDFLGINVHGIHLSIAGQLCELSTSCAHDAAPNDYDDIARRDISLVNADNCARQWLKTGALGVRDAVGEDT